MKIDMIKIMAIQTNRNIHLSWNTINNGINTIITWHRIVANPDSNVSSYLVYRVLINYW